MAWKIEYLHKGKTLKKPAYHDWMKLLMVLLGAVVVAGCGSSRGEDLGSSDSSESQLIVYDDGQFYCVTAVGRCDANDPFEAQLTVLGCEAVRVTDYGDKPGNVWKAAACPVTPELDALVTSYSAQQPYLAQYSPKPCTAFNPPKDFTWVSWDPTCPTCRIPIPAGASVYRPQ
jgi:hypothetical protein